MATKQELIEKYKINDKDVGSSPVQIALLTKDISDITNHLSTNPKDFPSRRSLLYKVAQRGRHQRYFKKKNPEAYQELIKSIGLRK